jgi:hypothetical protein
MLVSQSIFEASSKLNYYKFILAEEGRFDNSHRTFDRKMFDKRYEYGILWSVVL